MTHRADACQRIKKESVRFPKTASRQPYAISHMYVLHVHIEGAWARILSLSLVYTRIWLRS